MQLDVAGNSRNGKVGGGTNINPAKPSQLLLCAKYPVSMECERNYVSNVNRDPHIPATAHRCTSDKIMLPSSALSLLLAGKAPNPDAAL